ncbi:hypothetical protein D9M73_51240 [compost metagenome]
MAPQIDNPHDWAVWLLDSLEVQQVLAPGHVEGKLPAAWDFNETIASIGNGAQLVGLTDEPTRTIEFYPQRAGVFAALQDMFAYPNNLRNVPSRFTLRDIAFTYDELAVQQATLVLPPQVANYLAAAKLCNVLPLVADMSASNGTLQHFIKSPDSRIEVKLSYQAGELAPLPSLPFFETEFALSDLHKDQKRSIVRSVLLDAFKARKSITVGDVLPRFERFVEDVRSNYAMYAAEFSFEKIKAEVEKDNLDSTLKLNKTLSEIQNQLLAMPVALVLVGGQMTPDTGLSIKNVVIWLGACVFAGLMILLIRNQRHAIDAITEEIRLRKIKVDSQPDGMAGKFKSGFEDLGKRAEVQKKTLTGLRWCVFVSVALATGLLVWYSLPEWHKTLVAGAIAQAANAPTIDSKTSGSASAVSVPASAASKPKSTIEFAINDMNAVNAKTAASAAASAFTKR